MATPISSLSNDIASLCLHHPNHFHIQLHQTEHRLALISNWPISEGDSILEIGCGQGDCTAVLAELVGPQGHITAIDPAPLTYGVYTSAGKKILTDGCVHRITVYPWSISSPPVVWEAGRTDHLDSGRSLEIPRISTRICEIRRRGPGPLYLVFFIPRAHNRNPPSPLYPCAPHLHRRMEPLLLCF